MADESHELTRILREGGEERMERLLPLVYTELRRVADARFRDEGAGHTLQPTALVHEAFLRLADSRQAWRDRRHFYGAASEAMRRVLVDYARRGKAERRGGDRLRVTLGGVDPSIDIDGERVLELDDAIARLEELDSRAAEVARLRFFAGLELEEIGAALGVSRSTVMREWKYVRARMRQLFQDGEGAE